jgi:hypothetical protein
MNRLIGRSITVVMGVALALSMATGAFAAVTFDSATGTGFVGKGDVQNALGLNNAQLQAQAETLQFSVSSTDVTTWTCTRPAATPNEPDRVITQQRNTTTTTEGLLSSVARVRNQITGFNLTGYSGSTTVTTDGPAVGSCPANPSGYEYDENAATESGASTLFVNGVAL